MKFFLLNIIFFAAIFYSCDTNAQTGFYVPKSAKIFFGGDTSTIFSNVINDGNFGIGRKAFVNFFGAVWQNDPQSFITDESNFFPSLKPIGGWVRFMSPNGMQTINGGYNAATKTGPAFFNIDFQNPSGVELAQSNLKIRKSVKMTNGLVYLRNYILTVGNNDPGVIRGYDSSRFFVTNNIPGSGYLLREGISNSDGRVDFPIGSHPNSYTPLAVKSNLIQSDDYYANVFDSVKTDGITGINMNTKSVNKTWEVGKRFNPDIGEDEIFLQHLNADEGSFFNQHKQNAYVAEYNGGWDIGSPQLFPDSGYLTTGNILRNSGVNSRIFYGTISNSSFFTKLTGIGDSVKTKLWFTGWRVNKDLVHLQWRTQPEVNLKYFIIQRMLTNETVYSDRDTVNSQAPNSVSYALHVYNDDDPNSYTGISFYRLKLVNSNNSFTYSPVIAIGNKPGPYINLLWPNPNRGRFFVSLNPIAPVQKIILTNVLGQKIIDENVNGRTIIQLGEDGRFASGTYFVTLLTAEGAIIETKKVIIAK